MIHLTLDHLLSLHEFATGQRPAAERVVNAQALGYCVLRPQEEREGREVYPTLGGKAAAIAQAIVCTQPFLDGNRRTAWMTCRTFLLLNGYRLTDVPQEISRLLARVKSGEIAHDELRGWIDARLKTVHTTPE